MFAQELHKSANLTTLSHPPCRYCVLPSGSCREVLAEKCLVNIYRSICFASFCEHRFSTSGIMMMMRAILSGLSLAAPLALAAQTQQQAPQ